MVMLLHHLEGWRKLRPQDPTPRVFESEGPGWGPRNCISRKFPDGVDAAGPGTPL